MNFNHLVKTLAILPTYKCTAECEGCCYSCSPREQKVLDFSFLEIVIAQAQKYFPNYSVNVVTGGECFTLGNRLPELLSLINSKTTTTRCVSNGFWGKNYKQASLLFKNLCNNGLTELNISSGISHNKYVPISHVINALEISISNDVSTVLSIEDDVNDIMLNNFMNNDKILDLKRSGLKIITSSWTDKARKEIKDKYYDIKGPCRYIYSTIGITPYHNISSCCGLAMENCKYLKLHCNNPDLFDRYINMLCDDIIKIWIYLEGPYSILNDVIGEKNIQKFQAKHICELCLAIFNIPELYKLVKRRAEQKRDRLYRKFIIQTRRFMHES